MIKLSEFGETQKYVFYRKVGGVSRQSTLYFAKATQEDLKDFISQNLPNPKNHSLLRMLFSHKIEELKALVAPKTKPAIEKDANV